MDKLKRFNNKQRNMKDITKAMKEDFAPEGKCPGLPKYVNQAIEVPVFNAKDTESDPKEYGYDSWREYWEAKGGDRNDKSLHPIVAKIAGSEDSEMKETYRCPMCGRRFHWDGEIPDCFDGCHMQIEGDEDETLYITPLCHGCNHKDGIVKVPRRMLKLAPPIKKDEK